MQNNKNTSREEELLKLLENEPEYKIISQKFKEANDLRIQFIRDQIIKNIQTDIEKIQGDKNYQKACSKLEGYTNDLFIIQGTDKKYYVSAYLNSQNDNRIQELQQYDLRRIQAKDFLDPTINYAFTQDIDSFIADINRFDMKKIQSEIDSIIKNQTKTIQSQLEKRILYDVNRNQQLLRLEEYMSNQDQNLNQFLNALEMLKMKNRIDKYDQNYDQNYEISGNIHITQRVQHKKLLIIILQVLHIQYLNYQHLQSVTQYLKQMQQQDIQYQNKQIKLLVANETSIQQQQQIQQPYDQTADQFNRNGQIKIITQQPAMIPNEQQMQRQGIFDNRERSPIKNNITIVPKNQGQRNYLQNQGGQNQKK